MSQYTSNMYFCNVLGDNKSEFIVDNRVDTRNLPLT